MNEMNKISKILSKVVFIDELIYLIGEMNYRRGGHKFNDNYRKRSLLFNPFVINIVFIVIIIREIISLFITNEYLLQIIGDFAYKMRFKFEIKFITISILFMAIINLIINYFHFKNNKIHKTLKTEGKQNLMNKKTQKYMKIMNKLIHLIVIYFGFMFSFAMSFISFETKMFIMFAIPWNILFCLSFIFVGNIGIWNMLYFIAFCFRSKLQIIIQNTRIQTLIEKKRLINNRNLISNLKYFEAIYQKIVILNKIWSKYLLLNFIYWAIFTAFISIQVFFGESETIFKVFWIIVSLLGLTLISSLMLFSSCVNTESKQTFKLLVKLFSITFDIKSKSLITLRNKLKVSLFQKIYIYL